MTLKTSERQNGTVATTLVKCPFCDTKLDTPLSEDGGDGIRWGPHWAKRCPENPAVVDEPSSSSVEGGSS